MPQQSPYEFEQDIPYDKTTGTIRDYCTSRGFPMGGIGTGGFNVFTDGGFGMFRTNHNWMKSIGRTRYPRGTFLALRCTNGSSAVSKILRCSYRGGKEFANIRNVAHTSFKGELPSFELTFEDPELPINARLTGFTSLIPHNPKDSSLPAAFFSMTLSNETEQPVDTTLLVSFENILGIGGSGGRAAKFPLDGPVRYNSIRKNYAEYFEHEGCSGVRLATGQEYEPGNPRRRVVGEYLLFSDSVSIGDSTLHVCTRWNANRRRPKMLEEFTRSGTLPEQEDRSGNSAAWAVPLELAPGESRTIHLYLVWWTPHHVIEKRQRLRKITGRHRGVDHGHYYSNFFSSAPPLAFYCRRERERLERETMEVPKLLDEASLPDWLRRYILNSTDSILVNTLLPKDGTLYTIEGVPWRWLFGALTGTVDQRLASHPYTAAFFPELDRSELLTFFRLSVAGRVPHGTGNADIALGSHEVPYGTPIKSFNQTEDWTDLPQSLVLQTGKSILQRKDTAFLRRSWQPMVEMMEFLDSTVQNNIPEGITTYDYMHYHPSFIYTAILHCATLRMMIELGSLVLSEATDTVDVEKTRNLIKRYRTQARSTRNTIDALLWDSRGFYHTSAGRPTIFTSALAGDWISRLAGFGPIIDYSKALSHSRWQSRALVDSYPYMYSRAGITRPLVHREADPDGTERPADTRYFVLKKVNNPWQSVGFQALEAIYLGRTEEGLRLIQRIWDKGWYEGYPWDMDHWGMRGRKYITHPVFWLWWDRDHLDTLGHIYMTHPVLWSVFNVLTGVAYHAYNETLYVSPRPIPEEHTFRIPVFLPRFWLMVGYDRSQHKVSFRVLRHFGTPARVQHVLYQEPDGTSHELPFSGPILLEHSVRFTCPLPDTVH